MQNNQHIEIVIAPPTLSERFEEMLQAYKDTARQIQEAFKEVDLSEAVADTVKLSRYTEKFSGQLAYLRLSLGRLKAAFSDAFAPIGAYVLPVINRAINRLAAFMDTVGAVLAAVMGSIHGNEGLASSADEAASSYKKLGAAAKRSLAGFDQLQRLNGAAGSGAKNTVTRDPVTPMTDAMKQAAARILAILEPLRRIDLTPLREAFARLWQTVEPLLDKLGQMLSWLWQKVAAPFIAWCMEKLFPALTDTFSGALEAAGSALGPLITGVQMLHSALQPVVSFIREAILTCLQSWQEIFTSLAQRLSEKGPEICTIFHNIGQVISQIWAAIGPILKAWYTQFQQTFAGLGAVAADMIAALLEAMTGISEFLAGAFTGNWKRAWNGILYFFKGIINSLIGLMNALLTKLTGTLNAVIRMANAVRFTVPKWVPGIGGQQFGLSMKTVSTPQIPYLARGAVLPANKPFLAMVGDQRHGTNIEAPLSTIQQAVGSVMTDLQRAELAGHARTEAVLEQILEAVLGISIGDELIAGAVDRYRHKVAVMEGVAYG